MGTSARRMNFDRICTDCGFHQRDRERKTDMCTRPVNLIDGTAQPQRCITARSGDGICGPDGRLYSAKAAVRQAAE